MKSYYLIAVLVAVTVATVAAENDRKPEVVSAVIVKEGIHSRGGIAHTTAISVLNRELLAELQAFFPGYHKRLTSDSAGGWESGHRVYFTFKGGETLRVTVSENRNGAWWSTGRGDFDTHGDFAAFLKKLHGDDPRQQRSERDK